MDIRAALLTAADQMLQEFEARVNDLNARQEQLDEDAESLRRDNQRIIEASDLLGKREADLVKRENALAQIVAEKNALEEKARRGEVLETALSEAD